MAAAVCLGGLLKGCAMTTADAEYRGTVANTLDRTIAGVAKAEFSPLLKSQDKEEARGVPLTGQNKVAPEALMRRFRPQSPPSDGPPQEG